MKSTPGVPTLELQKFWNICNGHYVIIVNEIPKFVPDKNDLTFVRCNDANLGLLHALSQQLLDVFNNLEQKNSKRCKGKQQNSII